MSASTSSSTMFIKLSPKCLLDSLCSGGRDVGVVGLVCLAGVVVVGSSKGSKGSRVGCRKSRNSKINLGIRHGRGSRGSRFISSSASCT